MRVGTLIERAFEQASATHPDIHAQWVAWSYKFGTPLPNSLLVSNIQRAGQIDLILRCMEDELAALTTAGAQPGLFEYNWHCLLADQWIGAVYAVLFVLTKRKGALIEPDEQLVALNHEFRVLRVAIEKHQIAGDNALKQPVKMQRHPPRGDPSDIYIYDPKDPQRSHIPRRGGSARGSMMWEITDLARDTTYWVERRTLSDRLLALPAQKRTTLPYRPMGDSP